MASPRQTQPPDPTSLGSRAIKACEALVTSLGIEIRKRQETDSFVSLDFVMPAKDGKPEQSVASVPHYGLLKIGGCDRQQEAAIRAYTALYYGL